MDKAKRTNDLVSDPLEKLAEGTEERAAEIRALEDQELLLCGGGEGAVCW